MPALFLGGFGNKCALCSSLFKRENAFMKQIQDNNIRWGFFSNLAPELNSVVSRVVLQVWLQENPSIVNYNDWTEKIKRQLKNMQKTREIFINTVNYFASVCWENVGNIIIVCYPRVQIDFTGPVEGLYWIAVHINRQKYINWFQSLKHFLNHKN